MQETLLRIFTQVTCMGATSKLALSIRDYEEDVEFCMWENLAETRIIASLDNTYMDYYNRKENKAYEEDDSFAVASSLAIPARRIWQG